MLLGRIGTKQVAALDRPVWPQTEVSVVMLARTEEDTIAPDAGALEAIARASGLGRSHLFVVRDGLLVGVISRRDLMELLSVKLELVGDRRAANYCGSSRRADATYARRAARGA